MNFKLKFMIMKKIIIVLLSMLFSISAYSQLQLVSPVKHEKTNQNQKKEVLLHTITAYYLNDTYYLNNSSNKYNKMKIRVGYDSEGVLRVYKINSGYGWINAAVYNDGVIADLVVRSDGDRYDEFDYKFACISIGIVYFNFED